MPRYDRLPGVGRIRCYDAGTSAPFVDRYLVLFEDMEVWNGDETTPTKPRPYGPRQSLSMSDNPGYALGVSQWGEERPPDTYGTKAGEIRWRRVPFTLLPEKVRAHIIARATDD